MGYLPLAGDPEDGKYSIGCFLLPPFSVIPLHGHPALHGMIRILHGSLHLRSFNWLETGGGGRRKAQLTQEGWLEAPNTSILTPIESNLHEITAGEGGALMLDVLLPDYCDDERPCNYYTPTPVEDGGTDVFYMGRRAETEIPPHIEFMEWPME